jgi:hypothetical protein
VEIPTPPTDSLYKFKAIGGILMILASGYLAYREVHDIADLESHLYSDVLIVQAENESFSEREASLGAEVKRLEEAAKDLPPISTATEADKTVARALRDQLREARRTLDVAVSDLAGKRKQLAILEGKRDALHVSLIEMSAILIECLLVLLTGASLTVWGFVEWERKLQRPQDELLQIQLEVARLALVKAKAESAAPAEEPPQRGSMGDSDLRT